MARRTTRIRSSRRAVRLDFGAIEIIGGLLTPDIIGRIAAFEAQGQDDESYRVPPGLKIRDEIARYFRIGEALWAKFSAARAASPTASEKFALDLLQQCFGFDTLKPQATFRMGEREFPVRHAAIDGRVPVVIAPVPAVSARRSGLDESLQQFGDGTRRRSATLLLQEYLNAAEGAVWGLTLDGTTLRLMRDNVSLTRPAWIEADLEKIFSEGLFPDFSALFLLIHQSRFGRTNSPPTECSLEQWRDIGRVEGVAARDKLRRGVEAALIELGQGFIEHQANGTLRQALTEGKLTRQAYFEELLRLVYRLIFLFAAEDRELLHAPGAPQSATKAYAEGYSLARLRERCMRRTAWDRHGDAWEGLKSTFAALGKGESRLGLPALGGLFANDQLLNLTGCKLDNRRMLAAVWRLAWMRPDGHPLTRVNWRDMETEELGSVYESLLELTPIANADTRTFTFAEGDETRGNARKVSGSYYTPDSLVQALLDESLNPLIEETIAGKDDQAAIEALLNLRIIDPACGSGHFLLAAARRLATRIARLSNPGTPSETDYRHWLREVARRSLFGVDRNPMAIELAKVALWIETVEPGKPLSFLDAHLRCGDSLLGVYDLKALETGIPDDAYKPLTGDDKAAAAAWKKLNKQARERDDKTIELAFAKVSGELAGTAQKVETQGEDDLAGVEAKRKAFDSLVKGESYWRVKTACDLYIAAYLLPKVAAPDVTAGAKGITIPTTSAVRDKLSGLLAVSNLEATAVAMATAARAFHWPLEFPQVFFPSSNRKPGFDLALGNPPWEVSQLSEVEHFAIRAPEIAALKGKARKDAITRIKDSHPALWVEYQTAKRSFDSQNEFFRSAGRFSKTASGKINTYALFTELFSAVASRAAIIVPRGIATDSTTAPFFSSLVTEGRLACLYCFENEAFIFRSVHHAFQFAILVTRPPSAIPAKFSQFIRHIPQLQDPHRQYSLSADDILAINPNTGSAPIFRSVADAELSKTIYSKIPIFIRMVDREEVSEYRPIVIQNFFSSSNSDDLALFASSSDSTSGEEFVPVLRGAAIHQFDHRFQSYDAFSGEYLLIPNATKTASLDFGRSDRYVPLSRVKEKLLDREWRRNWLIGWRDITNATNERTVIASVLPVVGADDTLSLLLPATEDPRHAAALLAILNSLVLDFAAMQKVGGTHIRKNVIAQFPVPPPSYISPADLDFLSRRVVELVYTSPAIEPFARDMGYLGSLFPWDDHRRAILRAELDAKILTLYGLTRDQLRYILDPNDVFGSDYPSETFRVLKNNDIAKYGEYRTAKLVLQAYDQLAAGMLTTEVVRLDKDKLEIRTSERLADGAWARPRTDQRGETGAVLVALLKALSAPTPSRNVRLASILALEPRLLLAHLDQEQSAELKRLIGDEAEPLPQGAIQFVTPQDQHWGAAVRGLRTSGALLEDFKEGTWAPGQGLEKIETVGWPDARAAFVLDILRKAGADAIAKALPAEAWRWLDAEAA